MCPVGDVVIGASIVEGGPSRGTIVVCRPEVEVIAGIETTVHNRRTVLGETHALVSHGVGRGVQKEDGCGRNQALVGMNGRAGTFVNAVQGVCAEVTSWASRSSTSTTTLPWRGNMSGTETALLVRAAPSCGVGRSRRRTAFARFVRIAATSVEERARASIELHCSDGRSRAKRSTAMDRRR